jgi:hypothetical protein
VVAQKGKVVARLWVAAVGVEAHNRAAAEGWQ